MIKNRNSSLKESHNSLYAQVCPDSDSFFSVCSGDIILSMIEIYII